MRNFRPRTINEFIQILWRRKLLVILFTAAVIIASYNAMGIIKNVYEANALVAISIKSNEEKSAIDVRLASVNQHLLSRSNLEPIITRHNLYGKETNLESAINIMRQDLIIDTKVRDYYPQFPISFKVTYRHTDPKLAMQVTNELVSYFTETNEVLEKQRAGEVNALDAAIIGLEAHLKQINEQQANKEILSGNLNVIKVQRANLTSAIDSLNDKEFSTNQHIIQKKNQISELEKSMQSPATSGVVQESSAYGILLTEKAKLEAQLKDQRTQYTDKNPKIIQTQSQIAELNKQIGRMNESNGNGRANLDNKSPEMRELRSLQRELVNLETDLELVQRDLKRKRQALELLPEVKVTEADVAASGNTNNNILLGNNAKDSGKSEEYAFLFNRYSSLIEKRDSLNRLTNDEQDIDKGLFQIVDKAVLPTEPVSPNKTKLFFLVIVVAILIGIMAALIIEAPRLFRVHNVADVEYLLGVPVLGVIPETLTMSENKYNRKLYLIRLISILTLTAALVPMVAILLKKFRIFEFLVK